MNSLEPSDVLALFRATSRKLFLPKFTFSALIVSKCTSSFRRLLSSDSIVVRPPNQGTGPARSGRLAVPPLWHLVRRELLPAVRPPEGSLGSASGSGFLRPAHPHDPVDARNRRIRPLRDHGLCGARRQPEPGGPEHSRD